MFVAVVILHLMNGSILMERQSEQHFARGDGDLPNTCAAWLASRLPTINSLLAERGLHVTIEARCDRLT